MSILARISSWFDWLLRKPTNYDTESDSESDDDVYELLYNEPLGISYII